MGCEAMYLRRVYLSCLLAIAIVGIGNAAETAPLRPNIVFIVADDLGWADVGFHGGKMPTPNLDRLKQEGVELTQHYVYPMCSPTRAALLSGRYATRFGVTSAQNERAFRFDTLTLARALKSVEYETAITGKWHLGSRPEWGPQKFGFDHSYGSLAGGVGPWNHRYKNGEFSKTWHRNGQIIHEEGHATDLIAREATQWLASRGEAPFFLYVPFTAVHIPIREPEEYLRQVPPEITEPSLREYAACIAHLDAAVGLLLDVLQKTGKSENTIVVFSSDNGGTTARNDDPKYPLDSYAAGRAGGNNQPLRGAKTTVYEGGVRVPTVVRWPGCLKAGLFATPVHVTDWMPTFCALAGYRAEKDPRWDGRNLWPALSGSVPLESRPIYIAGPGFRSLALRDGDWKLVVRAAPGVNAKGRTAPETHELFNLVKDPLEATDLTQQEPDKVAKLRKKLTGLMKGDRDAVAKD